MILYILVWILVVFAVRRKAFSYIFFCAASILYDLAVYVSITPPQFWLINFSNLNFLVHSVRGFLLFGMIIFTLYNFRKYRTGKRNEVLPVICGIGAGMVNMVRIIISRILWNRLGDLLESKSYETISAMAITQSQIQIFLHRIIVALICVAMIWYIGRLWRGIEPEERK